MPKRIPTPPPGDDEPRYLTVVHPFAINGHCNMELPKDRQDFARWVACCIDKDAFFAFFHKPSARDMVIIEVNRDFQYFDRILGEHRWSEFLRNPADDEKDCVSQVFYCTYNTGRIVQKNGWKRIYVEDVWFKAWSPNNSLITFPYPATHFCDVPVEDHTNHPLCRPLPGAIKTPPPEELAPPPPVVGSTAWIQTKESGGPSKARSAWAKGPPKTATSAKASATANGSVKKIVNIPQGPPTGVRMPAVGGGPITVKSTNVWRNDGKGGNVTSPPVVVNWDDSPSVSGQHTPAAHAASPAPPGLSIPAKTKTSAWGNSGFSTSSTPSLSVPPTTRPKGTSVKSSTSSSVVPDRSTNTSSVTSWGDSSPDSESGIDNINTTSTSDADPYKVHINFSEGMEEEFHGLRIREFGFGENDEDEDLAGLDCMAPSAMWGSTTMDGAGWDDDVAVDAETYYTQGRQATGTAWTTTTSTTGSTTDPAKKPIILCNAHGVICKKGICAEYAKQLRLAKREEEAKKRKEEQGAKAEEKEKKRKARIAEKRDAAASAAARPPQTQTRMQTQTQVKPNPFRGAGGPLRTNWRGAPRAIITADDIEKREAVQKEDEEVKALGEEDDDAPNASAVVDTTTAPDAPSDAGWYLSDPNDDDLSPASAPVQVHAPAPTPAPAPVRGQGGQRGRGQQPNKQQQSRQHQPKQQQQQQAPKKAPQPKQPQSWADQVEAASASGFGGDEGGDGFAVAGPKQRRGPRIPSVPNVAGANGWGAVGGGAADTKSSTSGWGTVQGMPW